MKTLKQLLKNWSPDEAKAFRIKAKEWLQEQRQWTVAEIINKHTRNCAHKFIMVSDLEELEQ